MNEYASHTMGPTTDIVRSCNIVDISPYINKKENNAPVPRHIARLTGKLPSDDVPDDPHTGSDAITSRETINSIIAHALKHKKYRQAAMLVIGFNYGLRISDTVKLRWKDIFNEDWTYKDRVLVKEDKTGKTAIIYTNKAVKKILDFYLDYERRRRPSGVDWNEYLFISHSYNQRLLPNGSISDTKTTKLFVQAPIDERTGREDMSKIVKALGLEGKITPHSMRKSFGYWGYELANTSLPQNARAALVLQRKYGHSDMRTTLGYIQIEGDETKFLYENLNLGIEALEEYLPQMG